ncbi:hypothetical protein GCWU000324_00355 [Kingella oralis ATCC 51147]|uniref:Uncharacterized protein n=1 Tax=Kingella oralis ATCC 51147 TaxID=629741 RepID=C4GHM1_9NEIS|nr:hypothetical protein GCWU000324_00355 [Kingella oralis ATCC 51147]
MPPNGVLDDAPSRITFQAALNHQKQPENITIVWCCAKRFFAE